MTSHGCNSFLFVCVFASVGQLSPPPGGQFVSITVNGKFSCGLLVTKGFICWGAEVNLAMTPCHLSGFRSPLEIVSTTTVSPSGSDAMFCGDFGFGPCRSLTFAISSARRPNALRILETYNVIAAGDLYSVDVSLANMRTSVIATVANVNVRCNKHVCISLKAANQRSIWSVCF
jgi:hypothetical protein